MSEKPWDEFRTTSRYSIPKLAGGDLTALQDLKLSQEQRSTYANEARRFLSNPEVQAQVDRLDVALLGRITLTAAEAKDISGIRHSLRPEFGRGPEDR